MPRHWLLSIPFCFGKIPKKTVQEISRLLDRFLYFSATCQKGQPPCGILPNVRQINGRYDRRHQIQTTGG